MNCALLPFQCHKNSSRVTAIKVTHKTTAKVTTPTRRRRRQSKFNYKQANIKICNSIIKNVFFFSPKRGEECWAAAPAQAQHLHSPTCNSISSIKALQISQFLNGGGGGAARSELRFLITLFYCASFWAFTVHKIYAV